MIPLAPSQLAHAKAIVSSVRAKGLPVRAAHIALATALTESALWMYANGNNRRSLQLPHDRVGWDHGSVGLFQQQVGGAPNSTANWGTTDELMDVGTSTTKFLLALGPLSKWQGMTNWDACQSVQFSAFLDGSNYRANDATAIELGDSLWAASTPAPKPIPGSIKSPLYVVRPGDTLHTIAVKAGVSTARLIAQNRQRYPSLVTKPDLIQVGWVLYLTGTAATSNPVTIKQRTYLVQPADNLTLISRHYKGVTAQEIAQANHLSNPDILQVGQRLVIPT